MTAEAERILVESGAVQEGHFLLTSGRHSPVYVEKFNVLQRPRYAEQLCKMIADHFRDQNVEVVAAPAVGAIIIAYEVARQLGGRSIFAEREEGNWVFRRGFALSPGERTLVVEDVVTTGGSVEQVLSVVRGHGAQVVGVGILVDRLISPVDFGAPLFSCHRVSLPTYTPDECPLCAKGLPVTKPGSSGLTTSP